MQIKVNPTQVRKQMSHLVKSFLRLLISSLSLHVAGRRQVRNRPDRQRRQNLAAQPDPADGADRHRPAAGAPRQEEGARHHQVNYQCCQMAKFCPSNSLDCVGFEVEGAIQGEEGINFAV